MSNVRLDQVSFRYKGQSQWLIDQVSLEVKSGSSVSILGPSGCGKSTLFYLLGALYPPESGKIWINEKEITKRGLVGYMPQDSSLFPWMTVKENILFGGKLGRSQLSFPLMHWLEKADLAQVANHYPHQLSGGMQQRVSFLRALASGQSFICLDEPFASLDAFTRQKMQQWLASLMDNDQTFLLITHQIEEAVLLTDRILLFPTLLKNNPEEIINPFSRSERFQARETTGFWEFVQKIEYQLKKQHT
ncbi:ABC transporter ATP-binding protein [Shimazuella kribbensis]|uniref:ABC transporter ATP-binding protein n=1 Tax=Shimazuella kribbensis TaxID=139808 RepID=UPI000401E982|nr:ATP-binding cassette domain-containing protein [Shimazuella kribbensis]